MKSIERRFKENQEKDDGSSTFINFLRAVRWQHFSRDRIGRYFPKLVDPDDYDPKEKRSLLKWLFELSSSKRTGKKT